MIDDIDLNKAAIIRRCLKRISEEYRGNPSRLDDFTIQDSIVSRASLPPRTKHNQLSQPRASLGMH